MQIPTGPQTMKYIILGMEILLQKIFKTGNTLLAESTIISPQAAR